ncbi:MAG TPA: CPBP family intramembrane glutamic endopeptidase, partial [Kofleriaceae bacterium]|nr:CPBP family intramembrane glutamic endopeptidase [Kofleriaceae bacterium]
LGKTTEGAVMASLAAAEIGTAVAVGVNTEHDSDGDGDPDPLAHPGVYLPLAGLQDLWVYGLADGWITGALARRERFAPPDTAADLLAAPFNLEVMKRPAVWAGLAGALAVGLGVTFALSDEIDGDQVGDDPNLFGETVDGKVGYPLGGLAAGTLFAHVALAEEALFRGYIQSTSARVLGETPGWVAASLLFGLAHVPNMYGLPEEDRDEYLLYGIPVITAAGFYLGWVYRHSDYSLAPPTAIHFWYDFLLTATLFVADPENSIFAPSVMFTW